MDNRKRGRVEFGNGGFKKSKPEIDSLQSGIGSKSKPCTKFFSISGCPFGENCHFLHYVPGGYNAVAQIMNLSPSTTSKPVTPVLQNGTSASTVLKSKMCNKYKTAEGCKYGDKCHFAHGEWELGKPISSSQENFHHATGSIPGYFGARAEPRPPMPGPASGFGATATAKISVDASHAGAVIGRGGATSQQICRQTGVKLSIRDHESHPSLKNIELEGTFEQIQQASAMVRDIISSVGAATSAPNAPRNPFGATGVPATPGNNFKTKICDNFSKGSCTFGDRCHFAHGAGELRKTGI